MLSRRFKSKIICKNLKKGGYDVHDCAPKIMASLKEIDYLASKEPSLVIPSIRDEHNIVNNYGWVEIERRSPESEKHYPPVGIKVLLTNWVKESRVAFAFANVGYLDKTKTKFITTGFKNEETGELALEEVTHWKAI